MYEYIELDTIKDRFIYREDLCLMVDRLNNQIFNFDEIGNEFAKATFTNDTLEAVLGDLTNIFDADKSLLSDDYLNFWNKIFNDSKKNENDISINRGGAPKWLNTKNMTFPLSLEVELTKFCNWDCKFCYNVWKYDGTHINNKGYLPKEIFKIIIDECYENGILNLRLSGGEPTLHPEFNELLQIASRKNIDISLFTNGTNINDKNIDYMINNGVNHILLSLHGLKSKHNNLVNNDLAYDNTINAIKLAISKNILVSVETILTNDSDIDELLKLANLFTEIGVTYWNLMPYVNTSSEHSDQDEKLVISYNKVNNFILKIKEKFKNLQIHIPCSPKFCLDEKKPLTDIHNFPDISYDGHCGAGTLWCSISYDGKIRHCPHSNIYAGDVYQGIKKIYNKKILPKMNKILSNLCECKSCIAVNECKMGCHLYKVQKYD